MCHPLIPNLSLLNSGCMRKTLVRQKMFPWDKLGKKMHLAVTESTQLCNCCKQRHLTMLEKFQAGKEGIQ